MIDDTYTLQEIIGFGGSSKVFSATDENMNKFAIKAIRKDKGYEANTESMMVLREYLVMEHIGEHPNVWKHFSCNPEGTLQHGGELQTISYNVMEFCENGSLSTIIKRTGAIEENIARFIFLQMSSAIEFLHSQNFCHLDIKLENTLLDEFFNAKLADFGSGVSLLKTAGQTNHKVGTPLYMAPEVRDLSQNETFDGLKADIYSLGVTLWIMLLGEFPKQFTKENASSTIGSSDATDDEIMSCADEEDQYIKENYLSSEWNELLSWMLQADPLKRPSIQEILSHPWISQHSYEGIQSEVYSEMKARIDSIINKRCS